MHRSIYSFFLENATALTLKTAAYFMDGTVLYIQEGTRRPVRLRMRPTKWPGISQDTREFINVFVHAETVHLEFQGKMRVPNRPSKG